jgi:hypothetical protein
MKLSRDLTTTTSRDPKVKRSVLASVGTFIFDIKSSKDPQLLCISLSKTQTKCKNLSMK